MANFRLDEEMEVCQIKQNSGTAFLGRSKLSTADHIKKTLFGTILKKLSRRNEKE